MEVDDSSRQPTFLVGRGRTHLEVRSMRRGYYSRRSQHDDDQVEPEGPATYFVSYMEPEDDARPRAAATSAAIFGLKEVRAGDAASQSECAVCLRDFDAEETLRAMPCSHAFHQRCIFHWLRRNGVCPLCRHQLPTEEAPVDQRAVGH
ncbi:unnamed protein product [Urochloa decumbens]|uniref:RING-type domain-containing protein n=1 Tax=Urochloa decumbens TaxID=240449 RepID=A0ABC8WPI0_9POAL